MLRFGPETGEILTADLSAIRGLIVVGAGKASAEMGSALEDLIDDMPGRGAITIPHGQPSALRRIRTLHAAHPVPDAAGVAAAREISALVTGAEADDLVIALFSGGGSALLPAPADGITLEEKQQVTGLLLRSGANIAEVNTVRKHLSFMKGGRLGRLAAPARVVTLLISDVVGDDLSVIASGPTAADPTTVDDALAVVRKFGLERALPPSVRAHLERGGQETPKPGDPMFARIHNLVVARNADALEAMASKARTLGYAVVVLPGSVEGEARTAAERHIARCRALAAASGPGRLCILSGGETTVTVRGPGRGGRNQEFALSASVAMQGWNTAVLLSAGTDGIDGVSSAAGAFADGTTCDRAKSRGIDPAISINRNDSNTFFSSLGDLLVTGATGTNVMDVQILLCEET